MVNCVTKCVRSFFSCLGCPLSNAPDYEHEIKPITEPMPEPKSINELNNIPEKPKRPETLKTNVSSEDSSADVFISPKSQDTSIEELFPEDKEVIHKPKQLEIRYGELSFRNTQIEKEKELQDNSAKLLEFESPGSENKNYWTEDNIEDNPEDNIEDNPEDNPEDNIEDNAEDNIEDNAEDNIEDNIEEKIRLEEDNESDSGTNNIENIFSDNEE